MDSMIKGSKLEPHAVEVVAFDPRWAAIYRAERALLLEAVGPGFVELEHIGSTAVPNQRAKPIIDMMAAVRNLDDLEVFLRALNSLGYDLIDAGMRDRFFLRKRRGSDGQVFHLHIVALSSWAERKERLMRDYLLDHPEAVEAYSALKARLAVSHAEDSLEYTRAKTDFIQDLVDRARDGLGLPRVDVWDE